jgi:hypothetical protein
MDAWSVLAFLVPQAKAWPIDISRAQLCRTWKFRIFLGIVLGSHIYVAERSILRKLVSTLDTRRSARKHKKGSFLTFRGTHTSRDSRRSYLARPVGAMYILTDSISDMCRESGAAVRLAKFCANFLRLVTIRSPSGSTRSA